MYLYDYTLYNHDDGVHTLCFVSRLLSGTNPIFDYTPLFYSRFHHIQDCT